MLYLIEGKVIKKTPSGAVIKAGNLGFMVQLPQQLLSEVKEGEEVSVYTAVIFRNDSFEIYGFKELFDRDLFDVLRAIDSVGSRLAFRIVSTLGREGVLEAVTKKNPVLLEKVEGIGKKTALKVLLELTNRLDARMLKSFEAGSEEIEVAKQALEKLGLRGDEIVRVFSEIDFGKLKTADEIIKEALKKIGKGR